MFFRHEKFFYKPAYPTQHPGSSVTIGLPFIVLTLPFKIQSNIIEIKL